MTVKARPAAPGPRTGRLAEILRVDHAGEYGAVAIYRGQQAVLKNADRMKRTRHLIAEMEAGEAHHLSTFDRLLTKRGVRPTALAPLWQAAGWTLGAGTALMGEKAAMACTSAVEEVIEQHYGAQVAELGDDEAPLRETLAEFREDEIGHHDTAIAEGAEDAPGYRFMKQVIAAGCRAAIRISEKV